MDKQVEESYHFVVLNFFLSLVEKYKLLQYYD